MSCKNLILSISLKYESINQVMVFSKFYQIWMEIEILMHIVEILNQLYHRK